MDWTQKLKELQAAGVTQAQIAERAGLKSSSPVSDLANGRSTRPSWNLGQAVIELHGEFCGPDTAAEHRRVDVGVIDTGQGVLPDRRAPTEG